MPKMSKERFGEIAILAWKRRLFKDGIEINPSEMKREVKNYADSLGISMAEVAEFYQQGLDFTYQECKKVLESLQTGKVEEKSS